MRLAPHRQLLQLEDVGLPRKRRPTPPFKLIVETTLHIGGFVRLLSRADWCVCRIESHPQSVNACRTYFGTFSGLFCAVSGLLAPFCSFFAIGARIDDT